MSRFIGWGWLDLKKNETTKIENIKTIFDWVEEKALVCYLDDKNEELWYNKEQWIIKWDQWQKRISDSVNKSWKFIEIKKEENTWNEIFDKEILINKSKIIYILLWDTKTQTETKEKTDIELELVKKINFEWKISHNWKLGFNQELKSDKEFIPLEVNIHWTSIIQSVLINKEHILKIVEKK